MSRKWERMVAKNSKVANKRREKQGKGKISAKDQDRFLGRGWFFPVILVLVGLFYLIAFSSSAGTTIYWVTAGSYMLLGLILFLRRPFFQVKRSELSIRRWNAIKTVSADDIEQILLQDGYVVVALKKHKSRWVLSRLVNRYDTNAIGERMRTFAKGHAIALKDETKAGNRQEPVQAIDGKEERHS